MKSSSRFGRFTLMTALASATVASGCAADTEESTARDDDLTGGKVAKQGDFASTLRVTTRSGSCTGAKVGPQHVLLAAHCVDDDTLRVGDSFTVNDGVTPVFERDVTVRVKRLHIPHLWASLRVATRVLDPAAPPDVAVIEVERSAAFDALRAAVVDLRPVAPGDEVTVVGYGCEKGLGGGATSARLKTAATKAETFETVKRTSDRSPPDRLPTAYFFTPGKSLGAKNASICPGDSGGPVYRGKSPRARDLLVVGVNAYYGFSDGGNVSATNWHTRLDGESSLDVGAWLASMGVTVQGSAVHEDRYRACVEVDGIPVCGVIREAWEQRGAAAKAGKPTRQARLTARAGGGSVWAQPFGSVTLELDAALATPSATDVKEELPPDPNDPCRFARSGDKRYCGNVLSGADPKTVYTCEGARTIAVEVCAIGCSWQGQCTP